MKENKDNKENNEEIEVVVGDESVLNISEVGDCMNDLRPKSNSTKKQVIIPVAKKKNQNENEE